MSHPFTLRGLYAITDTRLASGVGLERQVRAALAGGARMIQYRDKGSDPTRRMNEARALHHLCQESGAPLIINDDLELAASIGADGIHLGRDDPDPRGARMQLGPDAIIGVSCYNRFELAIDAQRAGADYIAFGRFFPSSIKPGAVQAASSLLHRAAEELAIPVVAIGGITPENGGALIEAGANILAVIHAVFSQTDIQAACESFKQLFDTQEVYPQ